MKTIFHLGLAALLSTSCNIRLAGNDGEMVIRGQVLSTAATPPEATLTAGTVSTVSDGGFFSLHLPGPNGRVPIAVSAKGFAPTVLVVEQRPGVFHYHSDVVLEEPAHLIPGPDGGTFTVNAGAAAVFVSFAGNVVPFAGHLEVATFTPELGPGDEETSEGDDQRLQSLGLVHLVGVDASGHQATLGGPVSVSIVDAPMLTGTAAQKTYSLDDQGVWQPDVTSGSGGTFVATTAGFWQAARAVKTACVKGTLVAPNRSCAGERVRVSASALVGFDTAGAGGTFCVEGPQGSTTAVLSVGSTAKTIAFPSKPGSCSSPSDCPDLGSVAVDDGDCALSCEKTQKDDPSGCLDGGR